MENDSNKYIEVLKTIRKRYIFALSIIVLALISSQIIIQNNINNQTDYSRIINISGRQRMLSQQISKDVLGIYIETNKEKRNFYMEELTQALVTWEKSNKDLQQGNIKEGISGINSKKIKDMFLTIEKPHNNIIKASNELLKIANNDDKALILEQVKIIQDNEKLFLEAMDDIVFQYDTEAKEKIIMIKKIEFALLAITLLLILFEILFIFVPAEKSIIKAFKEINESRKNFTKLFEVAPGAMFLVDHETDDVILINKQGEDFKSKIFGEIEELNLNNITELEVKKYKGLFEKIKYNEKIENQELMIKTKTEKNIAMLISSIKLYFDKKSTILLAFADITNQKKEKEVLKKLASYDELTGLYNRRYGWSVFEDVYRKSKAETLDFSVCFIDIDGLKWVNDNLGHEEGDWYIKTIAWTIKENVNDSDCVFRYGGDEMVIIFDNNDFEKAKNIINTIEEKLNKIQVDENKSYNLSISTGMVKYDPNGEVTLEELVRQADYCMYENKKLKKACR